MLVTCDDEANGKRKKLLTEKRGEKERLDTYKHTKVRLEILWARGEAAVGLAEMRRGDRREEENRRKKREEIISSLETCKTHVK